MTLSQGRIIRLFADGVEEVYFDGRAGVRAAGPSKVRSDRLGSGQRGTVQARFGRYTAIAATRRRAVELLTNAANIDGVEVVR